MKTQIINLDTPPKERWSFLIQYKNEMNALLQCYLNDLKGANFIFENIGEYKTTYVSSEYLEEIEGIAAMTNFSSNEVLVANLYYDVLKLYFGCTAFAIHSETGMLHSRNLDWHTEDNILSAYTQIFDFQKNGKTIFKSVGWPGFIGVLSGIKPGRFSLTLNAVLSEDTPEVAIPISFLLREVLQECISFEAAKMKLENTKIMCDCLLLISGIEKEEVAVIERTPKRFQTLETDRMYSIVTNDYKKIQNGMVEKDHMLQSTSCSRYDRVEELIAQKAPQNVEDCLRILKDDDVMMGITVQQMIFNTTTGAIKLIKTLEKMN